MTPDALYTLGFGASCGLLGWLLGRWWPRKAAHTETLTADAPGGTHHPKPPPYQRRGDPDTRPPVKEWRA